MHRTKYEWQTPNQMVDWYHRQRHATAGHSPTDSPAALLAIPRTPPKLAKLVNFSGVRLVTGWWWNWTVIACAGRCRIGLSCWSMQGWYRNVSPENRKWLRWATSSPCFFFRRILKSIDNTENKFRHRVKQRGEHLLLILVVSPAKEQQKVLRFLTKSSDGSAVQLSAVELC